MPVKIPFHQIYDVLKTVIKYNNYWTNLFFRDGIWRCRRQKLSNGSLEFQYWIIFQAEITTSPVSWLSVMSTMFQKIKISQRDRQVSYSGGWVDNVHVTLLKNSEYLNIFPSTCLQTLFDVKSLHWNSRLKSLTLWIVD